MAHNLTPGMIRRRILATPIAHLPLHVLRVGCRCGWSDAHALCNLAAWQNGTVLDALAGLCCQRCGSWLPKVDLLDRWPAEGATVVALRP